MKYQESPPSAQFAGEIKCFWAIEDAVGAGSEPQPVLPDCCPEIVFNLSERFRRFHSENTFELQPRTLVAGQMTRSILIGPSGGVNLFGVRFHPTGLFGTFTTPMSQFTDRIENADGLWGNAENLLHEQLSEAGSFQERIECFESFLLLRQAKKKQSSLELLYAVEALQNGEGRIANLARELSWSERRLERNFNECVGVSPKMFSRIMRFQRLVKLLEADGLADLSDAAIACGYYDQSHMNHEFSSFAGTSPTTFLKASHRLSEIFVNGS